MVIERGAGQPHPRRHYQQLSGVGQGANAGDVVRACDDAVAAEFGADRHPPTDQFRDRYRVAQVAGTRVIDAGQDRDGQNAQLAAALAFDGGADDVAVTMYRDKARAAFGGPRDALLHRLADVEHLGVEEHLLSLRDEVFEQPVEAGRENQP